MNSFTCNCLDDIFSFNWRRRLSVTTLSIAYLNYDKDRGYVAAGVAFGHVGYGCYREVLGKFYPFFLHEVLEEGFSGCVVGEWEIEFLLGERLDKLFIHIPRLISTGNNSNSIFFF